MAKDKGGHGSEQHQDHKAGLGSVRTGTDQGGQLNAWGQTAETAKHVRSEIRNSRKFQLHKPPSQRRSLP